MKLSTSRTLLLLSVIVLLCCVVVLLCCVELFCCWVLSCRVVFLTIKLDSYLILQSPMVTIQGVPEECARLREGVSYVKYTDITQNTYVQS